MKILHVIPSLGWERGGPTAVIRGLARCQAEAGHRVTVLTTNQGMRDGRSGPDLGRHINVQRLKVIGPDRLAYTPGFARAMRSAIRDTDIVHVHSIFTNPVHVALREAREAEVPTILRPCGHLHRYSLSRSWWLKWPYLKIWGGSIRRACRSWHYTSEVEAAESWPWDSSPRFVLPNGIDPEEYTVERVPARAAVSLRWPELSDSPYVLFLGRLHPKKRLDLLIETFLAGAPLPFKLAIAGPDEVGQWEKVSAKYLRDSAARRRIVRLAAVTGQDKVCLLAGACLFALPSEHENFGVAALEALAVGTPVLLSPQVDLAAAAVADGVGYVAALERKLWRDRLASLLADISALDSLADKARTWARENFSWSYLAAELSRHYEWVIAGCPTGASVETTLAKSTV
jgi:glycosyltransferase involved in cell wall biosynthesis